MITRELWVWTALCVACVLLMVVYMAFTWGDLRYQVHETTRGVRYRRRLAQAESNLWAGLCISWLVLCDTLAAGIFLLRATGNLEGQEWAQVGAWLLIAQLVGVPAWVVVKLFNRRRISELE